MLCKLSNNVMSHDISIMLQQYVEMLCHDAHYLCVELVFLWAAILGYNWLYRICCYVDL